MPQETCETTTLAALCKMRHMFNHTAKRFIISALSDSCLTKVVSLCRDCSISATRCLSNSVHEVIKAASDGAHIPPSVMHSAQDAIAAIYYLLQLHGSFMAGSGPAGHAAICAAAEAMITSLKVRISWTFEKVLNHHWFACMHPCMPIGYRMIIVDLSTKWGCVCMQFCVGLCCMSPSLSIALSDTHSGLQ